MPRAPGIDQNLREFANRYKHRHIHIVHKGGCEHKTQGLYGRNGNLPDYMCQLALTLLVIQVQVMKLWFPD